MLFVSSLFHAMNAEALQTNWFSTPESRVRLISMYDTSPRDGVLIFGLEFELKENWHTYWINPGSAGLPPQIEWDKSAGVQGVPRLAFPAPKRFALAGGLSAIGYEDHVIYPIMMSVETAKPRVSLSGKVRYLVCSERCIPYVFPFSLELPVSVDPKRNTLHAARLMPFLDSVPKPFVPSPFDQIEVVRTALSDSKGRLTFLFKGIHVSPEFDLFFYPDQAVAPTQVTVEAPENRVEVDYEFETTERQIQERPLRLVMVGIKTSSAGSSLEFELPGRKGRSVFSLVGLLLAVLAIPGLLMAFYLLRRRKRVS